MSNLPPPNVPIMTPTEIVQKFVELVSNGEPVEEFVKAHSATILRILTQRFTARDPLSHKMVQIKKVIVRNPNFSNPNFSEMTFLEQSVFDVLKKSLGVVVSTERLIEVTDQYRKNLGRPAIDEQKRKVGLLYVVINELKVKAVHQGYRINAVYGVGYEMTRKLDSDDGDE